ncbi:MAG: hypothetical protein IKO25_02165 [Clostridia bacterium]|nr:hypothetical protein [Clostridia bacterium]
MKTIQELYNEIMANQELKAQFIEAANAGKQEAFLKEHGCEATLEEVAAFLKEKSEQDAPLALDELENAAGGECNGKTGAEVAVSVITLAMGCGVWAIASIGGEIAGTGYRQQKKEGDGHLCNL